MFTAQFILLLLLPLLLPPPQIVAAAAHPPARVADDGGLRLPPPVSASCGKLLDAFCGNDTSPDLRSCYTMLKSRGAPTPMVAGLSGPCVKPGHCTPRWRCYSPSSLVEPNPAALPVLQRHYSNGSDVCNCSRGLLQVMDACKGTTGGAVEVFKSVSVIPALVYAQPTPSLPNGSLVAFAQGCGCDPPCGHLCSRMSTDHGHTFAPKINVPAAAGLPARPRANGGWCCPQAAYCPKTGTIFLQFSSEANELGGCDNNAEQIGGVLQVQSSDGGRSWGSFRNISEHLIGASKCLSPTSGQGLVMRPDAAGNYGGRLVFCAVHSPYRGDLPLWSDDGGATYNYSKKGAGVNEPGLDECNIAQAANGSLYLISRNCERADLSQCGMLRRGSMGNSRVQGHVGGKRFAVSVSTDGGEHWGPITLQPQLITPVCQGSLISYKDSLYFAGPHSNVSRRNGTILASDDNGRTFDRSLNIFPYANGLFGYTGLACGMNAPGPRGNDCGVLFDNGDRLLFLGFRSDDVVTNRLTSADDTASVPPHTNHTATVAMPSPLPGWLGLWSAPRDGLPGARTPTGENITSVFRPGTMAISRGKHSGTLADYCSTATQGADVNTLWGMSGLGDGQVVNNPLDTDKWNPPVPSAAKGVAGAGMIQAAQHWSTLSNECPQIAGLIIDDFIGAYYAQDLGKLTFEDLLEVKGALMGKSVDATTGKVNHSSPATTPDLQLLVVVYTFELNSTLCHKVHPPHNTTTCLGANMGGLFDNSHAPPILNGVAFWPGGEDPAYPLRWSQEQNAQNFPALLYQLRATLPPRSTIISGIYMAGSGKEGDVPHGKKYVHWMSPTSVAVSMRQAAQLYDNGSISNTLLFAGEWVSAPGMNQSQWHQYDLPQLLETSVFANLGAVQLQVSYANGSAAVGALVTAFYVNNHTFATRKRTNESGWSQFGGCAGLAKPTPHSVSVLGSNGQTGRAMVQIVPQQVTTVHIRLKLDDGAWATKVAPSVNYDAVLHVSTAAGDDMNNGSASRPFKTIMHRDN